MRSRLVIVGGVLIDGGPGSTARFLNLRPSDALVEKYYGLGAWRRETIVDDLRRHRDEIPDAVAIFAHRADSGIRRITFREYAGYVERFAGALYELGVRPGDVVAVQLPNWWQVNALVLACARVGAVVAPIVTTVRERELERVLARLGAAVCVTTDRWAGFGHSAALAELAVRLPALRHRAVLGAAVAADEVDFARFFQETPWETRHAGALATLEPDPDRAFVVLFTSGTSGEPKAVLHTLNTMTSSSRAWAGMDGLGRADRLFSPHSLTHALGTSTSIVAPLLVGAGAVVMEEWEPRAALALVAEAEVSCVLAAPVFVEGLMGALRDAGRRLPALRSVVTGATTIPRRLVDQVPDVFGVALRAGFGTTEISFGTMTRPDDPSDLGATSVGRPLPGIEVDLRADGEISVDNPARLFVRSGSTCLATLGRDSGALTIIGERDGGWYDTGDLAVPDGRGGIRLLGRAADRIGGLLMIPVADVEDALRSHPAVADVALVGTGDLDEKGFELACAVVVPRAAPPTLEDLREHLSGQKMTEWYQPRRLEVLRRLPRNTTGKVQKELLRRWVRGEAELPDDLLPAG